MRLRVLLDENVSPELCHFLRMNRPTWEISHVRDIRMRGCSDEEIFRWAQQNQAIIITFDEDFANASTYPIGSHAGVVRLRVWPTTVEQTQDALLRLMSTVPDEHLSGSLVIIDRHRIRIRRAPLHG